MSTYWISDAQGRVLGPVGVDVIQQLWTLQRIDAQARISPDGQNWSPVTSLPGIAPVESADARDQRQRSEAAALIARLNELRMRKPHEIFGVAEDAPIDLYRAAFFRISKRFHPDRLPTPILPELKDASVAVFRFLSGTLTRMENDRRRSTTPATPLRPVARPVRESSPPPVAPAPAPTDRYAPETFVGLVPGADGEYLASIQVNASTLSLFYDHPLVNLRQWSIFISGMQILPLGSRLTVKLSFDDPPTTLTARGRVTFEAHQGKGPHGFGVMLSGLGKDERAFVEAYVSKLREEKQAASAR